MTGYKSRKGGSLASWISSGLVKSLVLLLAALPASGAKHAELTIGIIGDQTGAAFGSDPYPVLQKGVELLNSKAPQLVLHTGDLLESVEYTASGAQPPPPAKYKADYENATKLLDQLQCPWFLSAGDHDVNAPFDKPAETGIRKLFQELYGAREPQVRERLYYSFNRDGYHFIALSSQDYHNADPRWGVIFRARLSPEQISWLRTDLNKARKTKGTIVFMHQPLWYQWTDWAPLHALLREHRVLAVVAGHFHYNQDEGDIDGIRYIVVGATGGSVKRGSPSAGNLHHVSLLSINRRSVKLTLLPLSPGGPSAFSSRQTMDRAQAVALSLGNISSDMSEDFNALFIEDGKIKSCKKDASPSVSFLSAGNPLDVPVRIKITPSGNLPPTTMGFRPDACEKVLSDTECVLAPGALTESSNNSLIVPDYKGCRRQPWDKCVFPLWRAQLPLATSDGKPPALSFTIRMSFATDAGETYLDGSVTANTSCPMVPSCDPPK